MTIEELPEGFETQSESGWLEFIGFGGRVQERLEERRTKVAAAREFGMPDDLLNELLDLPIDARIGFFEQMTVFLQERKAGQIAAELPEFPERESRDPARRAQLLAERAKSLQPKTFDVRQRRVRKRDAVVDDRTKVYLRSLYTNEHSQLICQICRREMPFKLPDGKHYFEAVECFQQFNLECSENHLCLCPLCAAKYLYANGTSLDSMLGEITGRTGLELPLVLAGVHEEVRFVREHRDDLAVILESVG
jgi:hypothetical protein